MKKRSYWVSSILIFALVLFYSFTQGWLEEDEHDRKMYQFIAKEGKRLEKEYNLQIAGNGGAVSEEGIWLITIKFNRYGTPLTIEAARRLLVKLVMEFLDKVNADEILRPFLQTYPFTAKNVSLGIFNYDSKGNNVFYPYLDVVSSDENKVRYCTIAPDQKSGYKTRITETFDEALAIIQKENACISPN